MKKQIRNALLVVGCTVLILEEIQSLKEKIDDLSNK